jgi:hypothetical protein
MVRTQSYLHSPLVFLPDLPDRNTAGLRVRRLRTFSTPQRLESGADYARPAAVPALIVRRLTFFLSGDPDRGVFYEFD